MMGSVETRGQTEQGETVNKVGLLHANDAVQRVMVYKIMPEYSCMESLCLQDVATYEQGTKSCAT